MTNEKAFIRSLTTDMPPAPDHFSRCSDINRKGPGKINKMGPVKKIAAEKFHKLYKNKNNIVLDGRDYDSFAGQHIPGAYHIDCGGKFSTFGGWVLPPDKKILLVANHQFPAETMALKLKGTHILFLCDDIWMALCLNGQKWDMKPIIWVFYLYRRLMQ